jgi:hypothetical protein
LGSWILEFSISRFPPIQNPKSRIKNYLLFAILKTYAIIPAGATKKLSPCKGGVPRAAGGGGAKKEKLPPFCSFKF